MLSDLSLGLYLLPFLRAIVISAVIISAVVFLRRSCLLRRFNLRRDGERHVHRQGVSRWGGAAVILAFWLSVFADPNLVFSRALEGFFIGSLAILIFGIWDDFREIDWRLQLLFQAILAGIAYFWGIRAEYLTNPLGGTISLQNFWIGIIFVVGWLILSINAMNWLDGTDGLSGGVALFGVAAIFLLALKPEVNQPPVAIIAAALFGAILGFVIFNFHPGRIMAGTSGSMFFGFMLGGLAIFAGAKLATALLVMALPIVDFVWVIGERIKAGVSIFDPDRRHLHHKLLRLGWSQKKIALFFYAITLFLSILALNTRLTGKLAAVFFGMMLIVGIRLAIDRKIRSRADEEK